MPLPAPSEIEKLFTIIAVRKDAAAGTYGKFDKVHSDLKKILKMALTAGAQSALQTGVTVGANAASVASTGAQIGGVALQVGSVSMALFPIGAALGPWLGAAVIYSKADGIFALHDLKDFASGRRRSEYGCSCRKCATALQYIIDKKENNIAIMAVSIFTAGIPLMIDKMNSLRKRGQPNRPKELHSRQLVDSARGQCIAAMTAIMLLCGDWPKDKPPNKDLLVEVFAILLADDGWERLKSKW